MTQDLFVSTRKGLFRFQRAGGKWQQTYVAFLGQPVTAFLADPRTGHWYAALNLGHFGAKLHHSTNQGASWDELTMPTLPKSVDKDAPSLNQIWALEAGGADQPGLIWAASLPAAPPKAPTRQAESPPADTPAGATNGDAATAPSADAATPTGGDKRV